jgi:DNA-binding transcriptional regulator WhiA
MTPLNYPIINRIKELISNQVCLNKLIKQVSNEFNLQETAVRAYLFRHKLKACKCHQIKDDFFTFIDSEEKAYLLGFFIADGSIYQALDSYSFKFSVALSEKDIEIVKLYQKFICPTHKIQSGHYTKGVIDRKPTKTIVWNSVEMYTTLKNDYNVGLRKTYDLDFQFPFEKIPKELIRHFIRGFFDGDGHISFNQKTRQFTLGFYSTALPFLKQIGNIFVDTFKVTAVYDSTVKTIMRLYCLRFKNNQKRREFIQNLYNYFYDNSNYYLIRKKVKFENYLNTVLNKEFKDSLSV